MAESRKFTIRFEVEVVVDPDADLAEGGPMYTIKQVEYQRALIRAVMADPEVISKLTRRLAIDEIETGIEQLHERVGSTEPDSEERLIRPIIERLDPAARDYFLDAIRDGVFTESADLYYEAFQATVAKATIFDQNGAS